MSRTFFSLILSAILASCSVPAALNQPIPQETIAQSTPVLTDAEKCSQVLQKGAGESAIGGKSLIGLETTHLRLFNWNTHKNTDAAIRADLSRLTQGADLILLQEAVVNSDAYGGIDPAFHWSFSPGYRKANLRSGVTTASRIRPLAQCSLTHNEPWLRSPKATNITQYALEHSEQTLLVVNLHLINFTIGVDAMRQQLLQALSFVEQHSGPVIVAGDFNTWNKSRRELVTDALNSRGLKPVSYDDDHRKRFLGYALDHTYIRDISAARGTSHPVSTSDHNPMSVTLEL